MTHPAISIDVTAARLIHWTGTPKGICERKDSKADMTTVVQGQTTITNSGEANHPSNVTCPTCRTYEKKDWLSKRRTQAHITDEKTGSAKRETGGRRNR